MSLRYCPTGCGHTLRHADILCGYCMGKVSARTVAEMRTAWRRFNHTFAPADLSVYTTVINQAVREARLAIGAGRDVLDTDAL